MTAIRAWLTRDGFYDGEIDSPNSNVDWDTFVADAAKNGQGVVDKTADGAVMPPKRTTTQDPKRARLQLLRDKGWKNLTAAEQDEANALRFDLGF